MLRPKAGFRPEEIAQALKREKAPEPPPPPPRRSQVNVQVNFGQVASAASWAWARWSEHKREMAELDQKILRLAEERFGWLQLGDIVPAVGAPVAAIHRSLTSLEESGLCRPYVGKDGQPVYVFEMFLPRFAVCSYCDSEQLLGEFRSCRHCGAPLGS